MREEQRLGLRHGKRQVRRCVGIRVNVVYSEQQLHNNPNSTRSRRRLSNPKQDELEKMRRDAICHASKHACMRKDEEQQTRTGAPRTLPP